MLPDHAKKSEQTGKWGAWETIDFAGYHAFIAD
jgi:hypothetical protein